MTELAIPERYTERELIKEYKPLDIRPPRKIEQYACVEKLDNTYGRIVEAYYSTDSENKGELIALKYVCMVKIFNTTSPCYSFCQWRNGSSHLELYLDFDYDLLSKVIGAHYPELSLKDFNMCPGREDITPYYLVFKEHCIWLIPHKTHFGKPIELGTPMPVDYLHYY